MNRIALILQQYGGYLLVTGLASVFYNPQERTVGWYSTGKTGLIALGASAVLAFLFGTIAGKGKMWAAWAGTALSFLLLSYCGQKCLITARAVAAGEGAPGGLPGYRWFQAALFGVAFVFSVFAFIRLATTIRRDRTS